jgi:hypothetical protein
MNTIASIERDVAAPAGRRLVKEKTYTHQEVWENVERILNEHYGTDYKLKL